MSKFDKAAWFNSENKVNLSFPIAKVDKEKRTVSGFATLDNIDRHGDVVTADASEKAFARFRGNLREMHQPIAVGKVVSFKPQDFFDKESGQHLKGIYVDAYISKGAEDTWEKVLDGTLSGFSIGGNIVECSYEAGDSEEDNRIIKDYELMELSLVDSPANPLANIFSIQKSGDSFMFKGMATEVELENIFWCKSDQIATTSNVESLNCSVCDISMTQIGWVEKSDTEKNTIVEKTVDAYLKKDDAPGPSHSATTMDADAGTITSDATINLYPDQNKKKSSKKDNLRKGGNEEMAEDTNTVEEATEIDEVNEVVEEVAETTETVEEVASTVSEVPVEDLDFTKMIDGLRTDVIGSIEKNYAAHSATVDDMYRMVNETKDSMSKSIEDFGTKTTELSGHISDMFQKIVDLEKRMDAYENATAVKKSGDVENTPESPKMEKSIWQGHFLGVRNL